MKPLIVLRPLPNGALCGDEHGHIIFIDMETVINHHNEMWSHTLHIRRMPGASLGSLQRQEIEGYSIICAYRPEERLWLIADE